MRVEEACSKSSVNSAFRPFYINPGVHPEMDKQIVVTGADPTTAFIVYTDTKRFHRDLDPSEAGKVSGHYDWEPVAPGERKEG